MFSKARNSLVIANYFLEKAAKDGKKLTIMQLVKFVYFAHGWYMAFHDKPLIKEKVQAWKFGPVIPEVYNCFNLLTNGSNQVLRFAGDGKGKVLKEDLTKEEINVLDQVYDVYSKYSPFRLSDITHEPGTPWSNTTANGGHWTVIPNNEIKSFYVDKRDRSAAKNAN